MHSFGVSIGALDAVATGQTAEVTVTVAPPLDGTNVQLRLVKFSGSGAASFWPQGGTSAMVTETTAIQVRGDTISSEAENLRLEAWYGGEMCAWDTFSVVKLDGLDYRTNGIAWTPMTNAFPALWGTLVEMQARLWPTGACWPAGKPAWSGEFSGAGPEATSHVFRVLSTTTTDYRQVVSECGTILTGRLVVAGLEKLEYRIGGGVWADMPDPLNVFKDTTVEFRAQRKPTPMPPAWFADKPAWGGEVGGNGVETNQCTFTTASHYPQDLNVYAECGNTVTGRVGVYEVDIDRGPMYLPVGGGAFLCLTDDSTDEVTWELTPEVDGGAWFDWTSQDWAWVCAGSVPTSYTIRATADGWTNCWDTVGLTVLKIDIASQRVYAASNGSQNVALCLTGDSWSNATWTLSPDLGADGARFAVGPTGAGTNAAWSGTNAWIWPGSIVTAYTVRAEAPECSSCFDTARVTIVGVDITDVLDGASNSVLGAALDVKTAIGRTSPAGIRFRIVGAQESLTATNVRIRIRFDATNEAHAFLYGTNPIVRTLGDQTNECSAARGTNLWDMSWNGRNDRPNENRLLLAGSFGIDVEMGIAECNGATTTSSVVTQEVAKPHAGHFCGDWPRASVYTNTSLPAGGRLAYASAQIDENTTDSIYPMLDDTYDSEVDGGWWYVPVRFQYDAAATQGAWKVFTPTSWGSLPKGIDGTALPSSTNVTLWIEEVRWGGYPTSRVAFIARYNGADYDVYRHDTFWASGSNNYVDTGRNVSAGGTNWFAFDGTSAAHIRLRVAESGGSPPAGTEVAVLVFPAVTNVTGWYNQAAQREGLIGVELADFTAPADGTNFTLVCHRGYPWRRFWDMLKEGQPCGVDVTGSITASNGYASVSYLSSQSTNDYGNLSKSQAIGLWTGSLACIEFAVHGYAGGIAWYRRVYEQGDDTNCVEELFDPAHAERIAATNAAALDLDDVHLAILFGCHTADTNRFGQSMVAAFAEAGADIVLGWKGEQNNAAMLFARYFLESAFEKEGSATNEPFGVAVFWTNYPAVWQARDAAFVTLLDTPGMSSGAAQFVYTNCLVAGYAGTNVTLNAKIYPPRHGAKNKGD